MKRPTFESTIDILVKAYLNDTLEHGNCYACAVGNIVASSLDIPIDRDATWVHSYPMWDLVFATRCGDEQEINTEEYIGPAKIQIDATGYELKDLARIEHAFESAPKGKHPDEWMFHGLMAVVDVLAEIHNVDLSIRDDAKLLFVKP